MEDSTKVWDAWKLAKAYRTRPSEIFFIEDEVAAWCFDRAVHHFGSSLEAELQEAGQNAKNASKAAHARQQVLNRWLGIKQKFRDPMEGASSAPGEIVKL